jgi:heptosyltransferase-2
MIPSGAIWVRVNRFYGDGLMAWAALEPLRRAGLPLVVWGPATAVELFEGSEGVVATVAEPQKKIGVREAARLLRQHRPAALVGFPKSARPHLAAFLARVPLRLGCGDGGVSLFQTHSVAFKGRRDHHVQRYAMPVEAAFPQLGPVGFRPFRPRPEAFAAQAAQAQALGLAGPHVVFGHGAKSGSKRPGLGLLAALGARLQARGLSVVLVGGGEEDHRLAEELRGLLPGALNLVNRCTLSQSAAWICTAQAFVGSDSGPSHIAGAAGIPTLVPFGPTQAWATRPWGPKVAVVRKEDLDCLECLAWHCPKPHHPCMNELDPDVLFQTLLTLMEAP